jgi:hypothetical protein
MKRRAFLAALGALNALGAFGAPAESPLALVGVATFGDSTQIRVVDRASGTAAWLRAGASVRGFAFVRYDAAQDVAILRDDTAIELRLALPAATTKSGVATTTPAAIAAAIQANLKLLTAAARLHFLSGGSRYVTAAELIGPDEPVAKIVSVAGEDYRELSFMKGERAELTVTTAAGTRISWVHDPATR